MEKDFEYDYEYEYEPDCCEEEEEEEEEDDECDYVTQDVRKAVNDYYQRKENDESLAKALMIKINQENKYADPTLLTYDSNKEGITSQAFYALIDENIKEFVIENRPVPKTKMNSLYQLAQFVGGSELEAELKEYFTKNGFKLEE